jgi:sigma-B regulation protein RsbU (phosphoserine phosphatase)
MLLTTNDAEPVQWLRTVNGPLVGVLDMAQFTQSQTRLDHGDICLIYSDGVSEAMNKDRVLFGEKRMQDALSKCKDLSPKAILEVLLQNIQLHRQDYEQSDDITMLVFKRTKGE